MSQWSKYLLARVCLLWTGVLGQSPTRSLAFRFVASLCKHTTQLADCVICRVHVIHIPAATVSDNTTHCVFCDAKAGFVAIVRVPSVSYTTADVLLQQPAATPSVHATMIGAGWWSPQHICRLWCPLCDTWHAVVVPGGRNRSRPRSFQKPNSVDRFPDILTGVK